MSDLDSTTLTLTLLTLQDKRNRLLHRSDLAFAAGNIQESDALFNMAVGVSVAITELGVLQ